MHTLLPEYVCLNFFLVHFGYRLTANRELMCLYIYKCGRYRYSHTDLTKIKCFLITNQQLVHVLLRGPLAGLFQVLLH
jgi:hypothetical protein